MHLEPDGAQINCLRPLHRRNASAIMKGAALAAEMLREGQVAAVASASWWCALTDTAGNVCLYMTNSGLPFDGFCHTVPIVALSANCDATRLAVLDCNGQVLVYSPGTSTSSWQAKSSTCPG